MYLFDQYPKQFRLLLLSFGLSACGDHFARQQPPSEFLEGYTKVQVSAQLPTSQIIGNFLSDPYKTIPSHSGKIMLYFTLQSNPELQYIDEISFTAGTSATASVTLPNGSYTLAAIAYSSSVWGYAAATQPQSAYCADAGTITLNGAALNSSLTLSTTACSNSPFYDQTQALSYGPYIKFHFCGPLYSSAPTDMTTALSVCNSSLGSYSTEASNFQIAYYAQKQADAGAAYIAGSSDFMTTCRAIASGVGDLSSTGVAPATVYGDARLITANGVSGIYRFPTEVITYSDPSCVTEVRRFRFPVGMAALASSVNMTRVVRITNPSPQAAGDENKDGFYIVGNSSGTPSLVFLRGN